MLSRVEFTGYRCFKSYAMEGLARVNLLVGKNNCGKTALLEGIFLLTSGGNPAVIDQIANRRGEVSIGWQSDRNLVDVAHLFHSHQFSLGSSLSIKGNDGVTAVTIRARTSNDIEPEIRRLFPNLGKSKYHFAVCTGGFDSSPAVEYLFATSDEESIVIDLRGGFPRPASTIDSGRTELRFVGPDAIDSAILAKMWDRVTILGREADVTAALQALEPSIDSVHFLASMVASGEIHARGGFIVGIKGQQHRLPLGSLGGGMRRMLSLATALAFTKGGCLFLDEVDTGIHYSVQDDLWRLIVTKAIEWDIQVFATTHSWDCIAGLASYCEENSDAKANVSLHKIDRVIPHSIAFKGKSIVNMADGRRIDPR